ncbi:TrmH family RNA methyltransferase [Aggregatilineales bacterium SYSU G02658]
MPLHDRITSFQNPRVRLARQLQDKKARRAEQRFVIDYSRDLERALAQGYRADYVLAAPTLLSDAEHALLRGLDAPVFEVPSDILEKAGYRQHPTGLVAVMHQPAPRPLPSPSSDRPLLVLVALEKPGNIGALLRTADATDVEAVLLVDTALDRYNPNIIRASTGACFLPHIYELSTQDALSFCLQYGYNIISAHLEGTHSLFDLDLRRRTAVVLGTEDAGLSVTWRDACHILMKIPMMGTLTDSLNVSVAGAVILYEALRQRLQP